jgi:hypothetical protein
MGHFPHKLCISERAADQMEYHLGAGHEVADLETITSNLGFQITKLIPKRNFGIARLDHLRSPN